MVENTREQRKFLIKLGLVKPTKENFEVVPMELYNKLKARGKS